MIEFIKKHTKILEILFLLLISLTPLLWLKNGEIILGHDSGFRLDPLKHLMNLFYSWDPSSNFGSDWSLFKGFLITQAPETLLISITKSFQLGQQLTFIFWFFCIGISMYIFINAFFREREYWFFRVFSSAFYIYNFFILQAWFIAERAKFSLFSSLPLGILLIYKTLRKEYSLLKGVILFSLATLLLNAGGNPTFYGAILITYGITFIYVTLVNIVQRGREELLHSIKLGFFFILGFLTINAYWVLPQLYLSLGGYAAKLGAVGGIEGIIGWENYITQNASFINLLRLQGMPDWYDNKLHTYGPLFTQNPGLISISFIFPLILLCGLLYQQKLLVDRKKNMVIILMLVLLLLGLFLTAGSHPPLGFIYVFLIKFIPGFALFRSAFYKFGGILWFSYIFLISLYLNLFLLRFVKNKKLFFLLVVLSFGFLLSYHFPFFKGNFFTWNEPFTTKVKVPSYVNDMADYINTLPTETRIILLPELYNQADSYKWGFWGIDLLPRLFTNKSIVANTADHSEIIPAIYYSISQNDEDTFLRLTGISGINKLLFREDVLYFDKTTTGKNFLSLKGNLENFSGVTLEKKIGAWSLYKIESQYYRPILYGTDSIIRAQADVPRLRSIVSEEKDLFNSVILFNKSLKDKNRDILSFSKEEIVEAECIACNLGGFNPLAGRLLEMPEIKILPNSPFYYLFLLREERVHMLYINSPLQKIDANLGFANKRLAEIKEIANAEKQTADSKSFIRQLSTRYKTLINDSMEKAKILPEDKKNEAFIKIYTSLNSHFQFIGFKVLHDNALEEFEELSIFMQDRLQFLKNNIWTTNLSENQVKELLNVDTSGTYDLHIVNKDIQMGTVKLDGKKLSEFRSIYLTKGFHKLEISYPVIENLLDIDQSTVSAKLFLPFGERKKIPMKVFDSKEKYFVSFDYKISYGRLSAFVVEKGKDMKHALNLQLNQYAFWNSFNSIFEPKAGAESIALEFVPTSFETAGAEIEVRNVRIVRAYIPEVFISRAVQPQIPAGSFRMSFSRIDPTMYKVNIENSTFPFVLVFGEAYSEGWQAYIVEDNKKIPESLHYMLNGYSNGWLVDKKGTYAIIVEYFPQKIFYAGLLISGFSIFITSFTLLKKRKKL